MLKDALTLEGWVGLVSVLLLVALAGLGVR
jgi:hypothetical protein